MAEVKLNPGYAWCKECFALREICAEHKRVKEEVIKELHNYVRAKHNNGKVLTLWEIELIEVGFFAGLKHQQ